MAGRTKENELKPGQEEADPIRLLPFQETKFATDLTDIDDDPDKKPIENEDKRLTIYSEPQDNSVSYSEYIPRDTFPFVIGPKEFIANTGFLLNTDIVAISTPTRITDLNPDYLEDVVDSLMESLFGRIASPTCHIFGHGNLDAELDLISAWHLNRFTKILESDIATRVIFTIDSNVFKRKNPFKPIDDDVLTGLKPLEEPGDTVASKLMLYLDIDIVNRLQLLAIPKEAASAMKNETAEIILKMHAAQFDKNVPPGEVVRLKHNMHLIGKGRPPKQK